MTDSVRRVSVYSGAQDPPAWVDVALPARIPLTVLIPDIVGLAVPGGAPGARPWRLTRVGGPELDGRMTLTDHGIENGELLMLTATDVVAPRFHRADLLADVLASAPAPQRRALRPVAGSASALVGVSACVDAPADGLVGMATVAVLLCAVALAAMTWSRTHPGSPANGPLSLVAVALAAVCGFHVVPDGMAAAQVSLAAAAAATASLALLRFRAGPTTAMTASVCAASLVAAAALGAVLWPLPTASVGVTLVLSALAGLALAPRISVLLAGLAPGGAAAAPDETGDARAVTGHRILAGLVLGFSAAAAAGGVAVGVAALQHRTSWVAAAGFCAVVGVGVTLRARTFAAGRCRYGLLSSGTVCTAICLVILIVSLPQYAHWVGAALIGAGVAALVRDGESEPSPVLSRAVDVLEYAALAAVTPLACAVLDLFGLVRGLGFG